MGLICPNCSDLIVYLFVWSVSLCLYFKWYSPNRFLAACQVYPIGIPVLYAAILWENRELLNPRIHTTPDGADEAATRAAQGGGDGMPSWILCITSTGQAKNRYSSEEWQELEEKVEARREHPKLVPSMFLWKDFGECARAFGA